MAAQAGTRTHLGSLRLTARVAIALVVAVALGAGSAVAGNAANAAKDADWNTPRTGYGHPDLSGVWANNNGTPLQRPAAWAKSSTA